MTNYFPIKFPLKNNPNKKVLLVVGNLHARKKSFKIDGKIHTPIGSLLAQTSLSVKIRYGSGSLYNFRSLKVHDKYVIKRQNQNSKLGLQKSRSKYFDYDYLISETEPDSLNKN